MNVVNLFQQRFNSKSATVFLLKTFSLSLAYYASARLGLLFAFVQKNASPVWPPSGLALAALLLLGYQFWPAIALGALIANLNTGIPLPAAVGIATGNTLEALLAVYLLKRSIGWSNQINRVSNVLGLSTLAALLSTLVSATVGVGSLYLTRVIPYTELSNTWGPWWQGDVMGMIIITPFLLTWLGRSIHRPPLRKIIEYSLLLVGVVVASKLIFGEIVHTHQASYVLGVALFPFIIWAAYRFQQRGTSTVILTIATIAIWYTTRGYGPFATSDVNSSLMSLQAFLGLLALTGLAIAAAVSEQAHASLVLLQSQQMLEQRVIERTSQLAQANHKLQTEINERILADAARQVAEQDYQDLFENASDIIFRIDLEGKFVALNPATEAILGYQREDLIGKNFSSILDPSAQAITAEMLARKANHLTDRTIYEIELTTAVGQRLVLEIVSHLKFREHQPIGAFGIARDITHHKETENALRNSEQRLTDLINFLPDPTLAIDLDGKIIIWNFAIDKLTGYSAEDMVGKGDHEYAIPFYHARRPILIDYILHPEDHPEGNYTNVTHEQNTLIIETYLPDFQPGGIYLWAKASPLFDGAGNLVGAIETMRDITERKLAEEKLTFLSNRDGLTGLYNRGYFDQTIDRLQMEANCPIGMIMVDLDNLKMINDQLGHAGGDQMLIHAARVLEAAFRTEDIIARIGGDEFAVILPETDEEGTYQAAERLREKIAEHNLHTQEPFPLQLSIGKSVASCQEHLQLALQQADHDMYRHKKKGRRT